MFKLWKESAEPWKPFIVCIELPWSIFCCIFPSSNRMSPCSIPIEVSIVSVGSCCSSLPSCTTPSKPGNWSCKSPNSRKLAKSSSGAETIGDHDVVEIWFMTAVSEKDAFIRYRWFWALNCVFCVPPSLSTNSPQTWPLPPLSVRPNSVAQWKAAGGPAEWTERPFTSDVWYWGGLVGW